MSKSKGKIINKDKDDGDLIKQVPQRYWWLGIIFLILVSLREYLLVDGQIGHNWDYTFPFVDSLFTRISLLSTYTWWEKDLGKALFLNISHFVPNYLVSGLGYIFGAVWSVKILLVSIIMVSVWGFKSLLEYLLINGAEVFRSSNRLWWLPFSILYGFSPFLFNEIIGGSWYMWISYAVIPLWVLGLFKLVKERLKSWWLLGWLLSSIFVISSMQNFVLIEGLVFLYLSIEGLVSGKVKRYLVRYIFLHMILILSNLYWIIPFGYSIGGFNEQVFNENFSGAFLQVKNTTQNLMRIFDLSGYLNRNMYFWAVPEWLRWTVVAAGGLSMSVIARVLMVKESSSSNKLVLKGKKELLIWLGLFLILIFVVKGGNQPFGSWTMVFFRNFPLMSLYRSPQHLMLAPAFLVPLLMAYAYAAISKIKDQRAKSKEAGVRSKEYKFEYFDWLKYLDPVRHRDKLWYVILGMVLIWTSGWWINGDIGHKTLLEQNKDHVDFFKLPAELIKGIEESEKGMDHRVLFLPTSFSPVYMKTTYQNKAQGGIPEYLYLNNPTFSEEATSMGKMINRHFCDLDEYNWLNLVSLAGVRYLIIRGDILPLFTDCIVEGKIAWPLVEVVKEVDNDERLRWLGDGVYAAVYQVKNEYFLPRIYTPSVIQKFLISDKVTHEEKWKIVADNASKEDYQIGTVVYFDDDENVGTMDENSEEKIVSEGKTESVNPPILRYKKVNPTKYRVLVTGAEDKFDLVFSENYSDDWKIYLGNYDVSQLSHGDSKLPFQGTILDSDLSGGRVYETWFKESLSEGIHKQANVFANAWALDPGKLCINEKNKCVRNADGSYSFNLVIEYWPQRLLYLGMFISLLSWMSVIGFLIFKVKLRK